jgi:hypothetical protein
MDSHPASPEDFDFVSISLVNFKCSASLQKLDFLIYSADRRIKLQPKPLTDFVVVDNLASEGLRGRFD